MNLCFRYLPTVAGGRWHVGDQGISGQSPDAANPALLTQTGPRRANFAALQSSAHDMGNLTIRFVRAKHNLTLKSVRYRQAGE